MKTQVVLSILVVFLLSACAPGQAFGPTITPSPIMTNTPSPVPTNTPTFTPEPTSTPTLTPTPEPVCYPNASVGDGEDEDIPAHLDLLNVSTTLEGTELTVIFTVRDIPDEVTINDESLDKGYYEIAWGVAIDADSDPDTGGSGFLRETGYGYDYALQGFNIKFGEQQSGKLQDLIKGNNVKVWQLNEDNSSRTIGDATIDVDDVAKTITLKGSIDGMTEASYLHFFTFYGVKGFFMDEICPRQ